jgi:hypothetical protein
MWYRITTFAALAAMLGAIGSVAASGQSTAQYTQTINKAPTITEFVMPHGMLPEQSVTLKALVHTGISTTGITAPTPTISFYLDGSDSSNIIGTPTLTSATATNLLSYSEAFTKWSTISNGAVQPTVTDQSAVSPFGTTNTPNSGNIASVVVFPATSGSAVSGLSTQVTGTSYAGQTIVFSVWAQASTPSTLQLVIADGSGGNVTVKDIQVGTNWRRYHIEATLPAGAASGLQSAIQSTGQTSQTVNLFGAQAEAGVISHGVYVQTTGTGNISGTGAIATLPYAYTVGAHKTSVSYPGDSNYLNSASNTLETDAAQATASLVLVSSLNPSVYGNSVTLTATLTGDGSPFAAPGVITVMSGATVLTTCPTTYGAKGTQTCAVTTNALPGGTDSLTATYSADPNYNTTTSNTISQVVQKTSANVTMTSTPQPSVYGQNVTFTINVAGVSGLAVPTGTVTVVDNGSCTASCSGGAVLGGGSLTLSNGSASFSSAILTAGDHNIVITYNSADLNYE